MRIFDTCAKPSSKSQCEEQKFKDGSFIISALNINKDLGLYALVGYIISHTTVLLNSCDAIKV